LKDFISIRLFQPGFYKKADATVYNMKPRRRNKMVIITSFFKDESYGLLGPQLAATIIQHHAPWECIVIAVTREYNPSVLDDFLADYFGAARPLIGFSALSGREDLFALARKYKDQGAVTMLAGPQADVDFRGENNWRRHPHRFKGLAQNFNFALHGPAEQAIGLLNDLDGDNWSQIPGLLYLDRAGRMIQNPAVGWNNAYFRRVRWDNLYVTGAQAVVPLTVTTGQVLQQIGCPHAARTTRLQIDYPVAPGQRQRRRGQVKLRLQGCSFCDVAADKGFYGKLDPLTVTGQIQCLPQTGDGRKIPFELINENPLPGLPALLQEVKRQGIALSRINLTLRADWLVAGIEHLKAALQLAGGDGIYLLLSSIGFESFDDGILKNLNKGLSVETNLRAIRLLRRLKEDFPHQLGYSRQDGAVHGFIHPTPWDSPQTQANIQKTIYLYGLQNDILPPHSTPLIIHHASALGRWIREIERRENMYFRRHGSIIAWWEPPRRTDEL